MSEAETLTTGMHSHNPTAMPGSRFNPSRRTPGLGPWAFGAEPAWKKDKATGLARTYAQEGANTPERAVSPAISRAAA